MSKNLNEMEKYPIVGTCPNTHQIVLDKKSGALRIVASTFVFKSPTHQTVFIGTYDECELFQIACKIKRDIFEYTISNWSYLYYQYTKGYLNAKP